MPENEIGKVTHFFDKLGVAILKLSGELSVGDKIRIDAETPFVQMVSSMQVKHKNIEHAKKDDDIGMKVDRPCKDGDKVLKLS